MKNVIIIGATGMTGSLVLENCLQSGLIGSVTSIVRKPGNMKHDKLTEIIHTDFLDYSSIEGHFKNKDICFYCVGVYTGQVPVEEFKKITVDYTKVFADTLKRNTPDAAFCFLSGQGADSSEKSNILFAKQKGIAENYLLKLKFKHTYIFRPGYIYPVTPRQEPNFAYKLFRILYKPLSFIYPNIGVTSVKLAEKMFSVTTSGGDKIIYENADIRK